MRLTVFGATGGTGQQLVRSALDAGHSVTAGVRDPSRLPITHERLDVVTLDVLDPAEVVEVVRGRDAVLSALGPRDRGPTTVCTASAHAIVAGMRAAEVQRLLVVSASGPFTEGDAPFIRFVIKPVLGRVLRHPFADMRGMEAVVRDSSADWTIVRPPRLTDGEPNGAVRSAIDRNVRGGFTISRAALADFIVRAIPDDTLHHKAVAVAG